MPNTISKIFLLPGDYHVGDASCRIRTLLGSCVSMTLWSPKSQVGAMSHFVLSGTSADGTPNARYGEDALHLMLARLRALGVSPTECQAKIFGGGAMFTNRRGLGIQDVGRRNGEAAREMLLANHIPVVSESLYGEGYRKILFNVRNGEVWVSHVDLSRQPVFPKAGVTP